MKNKGKIVPSKIVFSGPTPGWNYTVYLGQYDYSNYCVPVLANGEHNFHLDQYADVSKTEIHLAIEKHFNL